MSLEFYEENQFNRASTPPHAGTASPSLSRWLISKNFAQTEEEATRLSLIIALVIFILAVAIFIFGGRSTASNDNAPTLYREDLTQDQTTYLSPEYLDSLPSRNE